LGITASDAVNCLEAPASIGAFLVANGAANPFLVESDSRDRITTRPENRI